MKLGIPTEVHAGERRVAATPDTTRRLIKRGFEVLVEAGAGDKGNFLNDEYAKSGATVVTETERIWAEADIVLKVRAPEDHPRLGKHEADLLGRGDFLVSFIFPGQNKDLLERLAAREATVLAMDCIPRITRAQKMDALSSMANVSGYRAVIEASHQFGRVFTGQITAAGKIPPAKVLVIGAGVAGLAAIGTANGLGAIVRAFDTRPAVRDEVRSMGAEFIELQFAEDGAGEGGYAKVMSPEFIKAEMDLFEQQAKEVDIIITTAQVPGKKAPTLLTEHIVKCMKAGSVIVDLAAEQGGNCELTEPNAIVIRHGVTMIGYTDLPSRLPTQASQLYGTNMYHLLDEMGGGEDFKVDMDNEVVRGALVLHKGELTWPPPKPKAPPTRAPAPPPPPAKPAEQPKAAAAVRKAGGFGLGGTVAALLALGLFVLIGMYAPDSFVQHFTVFVLAIFVGWQVVWNVSPALHTPLMSVTNAISGIIVIGGMLQISGSLGRAATLLGIVAVLVAMINVVGGFYVTQRMLRMFHR